MNENLPKFEKLIKEAEKLLKSDSSAEQAVVVLTSKGNIFSFANYNVMSNSVGDEIAFVRALTENGDTLLKSGEGFLVKSLKALEGPVAFPPKGGLTNHVHYYS